MKSFISYLERMIEGCDSLGGMEREKSTYQAVLKEYRKQLKQNNLLEKSEQLVCSCCGVETDGLFQTSITKDVLCFDCAN